MDWPKYFLLHNITYEIYAKSLETYFLIIIIVMDDILILSIFTLLK